MEDLEPEAPPLHPIAAPQDAHATHRTLDQASDTGSVTPARRHPELADREVGGEVREPGTVVGIGMRKHRGVERAHAEARQGGQQDSATEVTRRPAAAVDEERMRSVAQEDRVTLPDVEHRELD